MSINIISIIISVIIFSFCNFFISKPKNNDFKIISNSKTISKKEDNKTQENLNEEVQEISNTEESIENFNWYIEIQSIELKAPIKETTNTEILKNTVGHFAETPKTNGNVGLAAHNRGYKKNYFENIHKLKIGETIKYKYNDFEKEYIIDKIEIIKNTNWSYLENTKENKITLITCIENKPEYRRCVQATEKK